MKCHKIITFVLMLTLPLVSFSQHQLSAGILAGFTSYKGDLSGKSISGGFLSASSANQAGVGLSTYARFLFVPAFSVKAAFTYSSFSAFDSLAADAFNNGRNLHFKNRVMELSVQGEYNFYSKQDVTKKGALHLSVTAYLLGGIGIFYHNPKAFYKLRWYDLRELGTEGQGRSGKTARYGKTSFSVPLGLGMYITLKRKIQLGFEVAYHMTFTDYLDDVGGFYADSSDFGKNENVALSLSNRSVAVQGKESFPGLENYSSGKERGKSGNDAFITFGFTLSFIIKEDTSFDASKYDSFMPSRKKTRSDRSKF